MAALMEDPRPLHVLLVHIGVFPKKDGGTQHAQQIGMELARQGHRVTIWGCDHPPHDEKRFSLGGMDIIRIPPSIVLGGIDPVVSVRDLDITDVDIVHLHDTLPVLVRRTLSKAKRAGKPVVTTYHNDYVKTTVVGRILKRIRWAMQGRRTLHSSNARIVLTPFFEELLRSKGVKGDLDVIPNGFTPVEDSPNRPAGISSAEQSRPLVSFVGRLSFQKGLDVLMDAMDSYGGDPGFDLAIAGKGELSEWLDERVAASSAREFISVLGLVSDSEKRWMYENSDCVVIPSRFEGLPTVLLEAMHAGTPVIMADVNGLGSMVNDFSCGLSVPCEDSESLASAMARAIEADEEETSKWGEAGKAASRDYQWDRVTDRILEVYRGVLGQ